MLDVFEKFKKIKIYLILGGIALFVVLLIIIIVIIIFIANNNYNESVEGLFTCSMSLPVEKPIDQTKYEGKDYCFGKNAEGDERYGIIITGNYNDETKKYEAQPVRAVMDGDDAYFINYANSPYEANNKINLQTVRAIMEAMGLIHKNDNGTLEFKKNKGYFVAIKHTINDDNLGTSGTYFSIYDGVDNISGFASKVFPPQVLPNGSLVQPPSQLTINKNISFGTMGTSNDVKDEFGNEIPYFTFAIYMADIKQLIDPTTYILDDKILLSTKNAFIDVNKIFNFNDDEAICSISDTDFSSMCITDFENSNFLCNMYSPIENTQDTNQNLITDTFGWRSFNSSFHHGIDFGVAVGTNVYSVADGIVTEVKTDACLGNMIRIQHTIGGDEYVTMFAHLSVISSSIKKGVVVKRGYVIGEVGNTGSCSAGAHLHFVISKNGTEISPNVFFGYSDDDKNCIDPSYAWSSTNISQCDYNNKDRKRISYTQLMQLCTDGNLNQDTVFEDIKITADNSKTGNVLVGNTVRVWLTAKSRLKTLEVYYNETKCDVEKVRETETEENAYIASHTIADTDNEGYFKIKIIADGQTIYKSSEDFGIKIVKRSY